MANSPYFTVRMSPHLKAHVENVAASQGIKASELLKMLAVEYLARQEPVQEVRGKERVSV
jgi:hypothetical protein